MQTPFIYNYFTSHDSLKIRYGYTDIKELNSKGIILLLHGRAEFIEKYNEVAIFLNNKGYDVISFDWRGQGLSERQTDNRKKGYVKDFNDYLLDLKFFFETIIKPKNKDIFLLSHSMGGHIALRFLHDYPHFIKKAVFASPMFDIKTFLFSRVITRALTQKACKAGFSEYFVLGGKKYDSTHSKLKKNILSHDFKKFSIQANEIEKNPDLALGGATWGWLNAAYKSIDIVMEDDYGSTITTPVLIINAQKDKLVRKKSQEKIYNRLPICSYVSIENAFHEIMFETKEIRDTFWSHFDRFINSS
ncbi:MAG: alpha/beta hydrolase [Desulfobacteraceae bacterium]|nr:alpha/beta hydrolase [Desulfobacteraceae bacterium]